MAYTPGILSQILQHDSSMECKIKQTKLQALFSKSTEQHLASRKNLVGINVAPSVTEKVRESKPSVQRKDGETEMKEMKATSSHLVFRREEGFRNAEENKLRHKKKKVKQAQNVQNVQPLGLSEDKKLSCSVERGLQDVNAENAARRIAEKSGDQPTFVSRRDTTQDAKTVFVGNVALSVTKKTLLRLFKTCGKVQTVRLRSAPIADLKLPKKASVITQQFHPSRHTANFYVVFESPSEAEKAVSLNGTELDGYHIRVDLATVKKHDQQKSVFIGNIPFDCEEESLRKHFEPCGQITNVRIIRDRVTGAGKGFGYVTFSDASNVTLALSMNNQEFNGRQLRVQRSTEKPRKSKEKKPEPFQKSKKSSAKNQKSRGNGTALKERKGKPPTQAARQVRAPDEERRRKKFDAKAMTDHKKMKEQRKKKLRRRVREKKKESLGHFLTKQKN